MTGRSRRNASWAFSLVALALSLSTTSSFLINQSKGTVESNIRVYAASDTSEESTSIENRRDFLRVAPVAMISGMTGLNILTYQSFPAQAADTSAEVELPTKEVVTECFDFIRYQLQDPQGGVAYMQGRIDEEDLVGLLEFSRSYDLEFRKRRFGNAKKLLQDKEIKAKATEYANAVTFDLIGINRSCREGQENIESANKYLEELRVDVTRFLTLEETIQVKT